MKKRELAKTIIEVIDNFTWIGDSKEEIEEAIETLLDVKYEEQKPVVDEQKREMAQAIWANAIQMATHSYCVFCQSGLHSDDGIVHDPKCIVTKVAQYLEELEKS